MSRARSLFSRLIPELLANDVSVYRNDIIQWDDRPVLHEQCPLRKGDVPYPTRDGHIRATGLPVVWDEIFDGHFRSSRKMCDEHRKAAVQIFGLLRVQLASFGSPPVSFPCHQREDTGIMINGRPFFVKSELSGSMKSDAFEYEIAVTSVRNRRFMLVHLSANPNPKGESFS